MCTLIDALIDVTLEPTASPPRPTGFCATVAHWMEEFLAPSSQPPVAILTKTSLVRDRGSVDPQPFRRPPGS